VSTTIEDRLDGLCGVSLDELDERASLLRRVDRKYAAGVSAFLELLARLREDHEVLEIDRRRSFSYNTVYFDTPQLRCFWEHVRGETPRFKARTRLYEETRNCVFEVKLKPHSGEIDKRQIDHPPDAADRLDDRARGCLRDALEDAGLSVPGTLEPTLRTSFRRVTLAARGSSERLTCDQKVRLARPDGDAVELSDSVVLVETKTEDGEGAADRELARLGIEEISLSKYRVGIGLTWHVSEAGEQPGGELFVARAEA
jgi:VTC domain